MVTKKKIIWGIILTIVMTIKIGQLTVQAEKTPTGAAGFVYTIDYPDNQMEENLGYYKLKVTPGEKQEITINLSNPSSEEITVDVQYNSAKTNQNGVIEYGESKLKIDSSMKFDFVDIVKGPEKVDLKSGETKKLTLIAQMPKTSYDGVIAGGIQLMRANQEESSASEGSKVINQYAYVIGMLLQVTDTKVLPDLTLNKIRGDQSNYRNAVFVNISNVEAAYLNEMTVEVQVSKKGNASILYERKQNGMRMAPNSVLDFPVSMNGETMEAGNYIGHVLVTAGDRKWEWDEDFIISKEDAEKYNERDVSLVQEKGMNWMLLISIVLAVFILLIVVALIIRNIRKKKRNVKKNSRKRKEVRK